MACPAAGGSGEGSGDDGEQEKRLLKKEVVMETGYSDGSVQSTKVVCSIDYEGENAASPEPAAGPSLGAIPKRPQAKGLARKKSKRGAEQEAQQRTPRRCQRRQAENEEVEATTPQQEPPRRQPIDLLIEAAVAPQRQQVGPPPPPTPRQVARLPSQFPIPRGARRPLPPGRQLPKPSPPQAEPGYHEIDWLHGDLLCHEYRQYDKEKFSRKRYRQTGTGKTFIPPMRSYKPQRKMFKITESPEDVLGDISMAYNRMHVNEPIAARPTSSLQRMQERVQKSLRRAPQHLQRLSDAAVSGMEGRLKKIPKKMRSAGKMLRKAPRAVSRAIDRVVNRDLYNEYNDLDCGCYDFDLPHYCPNLKKWKK